MPINEIIALHCQISRSGFSGERVFRVPSADEGIHVGVAPREYFFTTEGRPLSPDQPAEGKTLHGLVTARLLQQEGEGAVLVSVPDGEVLVVKKEQTAKHPPAEFKPHVPLQS